MTSTTSVAKHWHIIRRCARHICDALCLMYVVCVCVTPHLCHYAHGNVSLYTKWYWVQNIITSKHWLANTHTHKLSQTTWQGFSYDHVCGDMNSKISTNAIDEMDKVSAGMMAEFEAKKSYLYDLLWQWQSQWIMIMDHIMEAMQCTCLTGWHECISIVDASSSQVSKQLKLKSVEQFNLKCNWNQVRWMLMKAARHSEHWFPRMASDSLRPTWTYWQNRTAFCNKLQAALWKSIQQLGPPIFWLVILTSKKINL